MFFPKNATSSLVLALVLSCPLTALGADNLLTSPSPPKGEFIGISKGNSLFDVHFDPSSLFSPEEKAAIREGFFYWARFLKKAPQGIPAKITVQKSDLIAPTLAQYSGAGNLYKALINGDPEYHGYISINKNQKFSLAIETESCAEHSYATNPDCGYPYLYTVTAHEIGHGLFDDTAKIKGSHTQDVLSDTEDFEDLYVKVKGFHIDLPHSFMYPAYAEHKFPFLSELELAFFQDQGWSIDRRDFFGRSIYGSNRIITNTQGYAARNRSGTEYTKAYNVNPQGIGLSIEGKWNTLIQDADVFTQGKSALGVFINGENNELILKRKRKIHANGPEGIGILIAKDNNSITLERTSSVEANGFKGIGLHSSGENTSLALQKGAFISANGPQGTGISISKKMDTLILEGNIYAYGQEGIGLRLSDNFPAEIADVTLMGYLSGTKSALYIGENSFVKKINIHPQAQVWGDILSKSKKADTDLYLTHLVFGGSSEPVGHLFSYSDRIQGKNLKLIIEGKTVLTGNKSHNVHNVTIMPKASLEMNGVLQLGRWEDSGVSSAIATDYQTGAITKDHYNDLVKHYKPLVRGYFYNQGLFSPGSQPLSIGSFTLDGSFWQSKEGTLAIDINAQGNSDYIFVTKDAHLGGTLLVRPQKGFYENLWQKPLVFLNTAQGSIRNDFHHITTSRSPTLNWGFEGVKKEKSYGVRYLKNPKVHAPIRDETSDQELSQIHVHEFNAELRQTNYSAWRAKEEEQNKERERENGDIQKREGDRAEERIKLELDISATAAIFDGIRNQMKEDISTEEDQKLRQDFEAFREVVYPILHAHEKARAELDRIYAHDVLTAQEDVQAENQRGILKSEKEKYDALIERFKHYRLSQLQVSPSRQFANTEGNSSFAEEASLLRVTASEEDLSSDNANIVSSPSLTVSIPEDAYSRYASTRNEYSIGRALDRLRNHFEKALSSGLKNLYSALDFSADDGSEIRQALANIAPEAYNAAFSVALMREHVVTDTLEARPKTPNQGWAGFVLPFAAQGDFHTAHSRLGYNARSSGLVFGAEKDRFSLPGFTWGFHGFATQKDAFSSKTADQGHGTFQAGGLGLQMHYRPDAHRGIEVMAHGRLGLEQGDMNRTLSFAGYAGKQKSQWLGWTSSTAFSGSYLWPISSYLSFGPLARLEYVSLTRPQFVEQSSQDLNIQLEKNANQSLRSSLGVRGVIFSGEKTKVDLQARWDCELLKPWVTQRAAFVGYGDEALLLVENVLNPLQSLQISTQANYDMTSQVSIGARGAAQFSQFAKTEFSGNLALKVRF
jgi:hypothetical protein